MDRHALAAHPAREAPSTLHALLVALLAVGLLFALMLFHEGVMEGMGHGQQSLRGVVAATPH